jgi:hypothetical protein
VQRAASGVLRMTIQVRAVLAVLLTDRHGNCSAPTSPTGPVCCLAPHIRSWPVSCVLAGRSGSGNRSTLAGQVVPDAAITN